MASLLLERFSADFFSVRQGGMTDALLPPYTYLGYYNFERAHTGRRDAGRPPAELVYGARKMRPR